MIVYPNAKLNIGLQVVGKRSDGYHLLATCFYPIELKDCLELLPDEEASTDSLEVFGVGAELGDVADNLVLRAVRLLREDFDFPYLKLYLYKHIPSGAGMGGGSADASFTLRAVNELFDLGLSTEQLEAYALRLGADCPFFIQNRPALGEGIGEVLTVLPNFDLSDYNILVVKPHIHISTADAFRGLRDIGDKEESVADIIQSEVSSWQGRLVNDFEVSLFPKYPLLAEIKDTLYQLGAKYASLTGSGSALFGLFDRRLSPEELKAFEGAFVWQSKSII